MGIAAIALNRERYGSVVVLLKNGALFMHTNMKFQWVMALILAGIFPSLICALAADHVVIPVSNPIKPVTVNVSLYSGSIYVTGYSGKDVIMDVQAWEEIHRRSVRRTPLAGPSDLKRISSPKTGLAIQEENNVVNIGNGTLARSMDISLQVPFKTSLVLNTNGGGNISISQIEGDVRINNTAFKNSSSRTFSYNNSGRRAFSNKKSGSGNIELHQVKGEIEINNGRGSVMLEKISGNVVAYAQNGDLRASFLQVKPGKPMSFSSMNGVIDVWLPPGIKANVTMQSASGEINSDFDIKLASAAVGSSPSNQNYRNGYFKRMDRTLVGKINGGGPEIQIRTYKGNIYIRKFSDAVPQAHNKK
jgi:hypothetical protein